MSASPQSQPGSELSPAQPSRRRVKRSYVACRRCHAHKVKCSGGVPCQRCQNTKNDATCDYPSRDRKVAVAESYLKRLEAGSRGDLTADASPEPADATASAARNTRERRTRMHEASAETDIANPLTGSGSVVQDQFIGDSTCTVFADRLLSSLQPQGLPASALVEQFYVKRDEFKRQIVDPRACKFPDRIRANLLVRVALRFIGQDYHFFIHKEFLHQLERVYIYKDAQYADSAWACKFFVVLALGELYSGTLPTESRAVPGTDHFVNASLLLEDMYEEPSLTQVEIMLLFCFYSNALGRTKSAHVYSGLAVRFATSLGLHRQPLETANFTPVELEHRIRLWWTAYCFDRSLSCRLGQPLTVQREDIDIRFPSIDHLTADEQDQIGTPAHLNANVELAHIEGSIMRDIYCTSSTARGNFLHNVRNILQNLRKWDANVNPSLRWKQGGAHRPVASIQLHFNQCIMLTTRPVLLHVLKIKDPFSTSGLVDPTAAHGTVSETARMLADSCIAAARTSNGILSQLYVENSLAIFGHFDAHYLFSSTLVLIIAAIIAPNSGDSDAVQTAFHLLRTMRDSGNVSAAQFYARLLQIHMNVGRLRSSATARTEPMAASVPVNGIGVAENAAAQANARMPISSDPLDSSAVPPQGNLSFENYEWGDTMADVNFTQYDWSGLGNVTIDPLDDPMLQTFLDHADIAWDENVGSVSRMPGSL